MSGGPGVVVSVPVAGGDASPSISARKERVTWSCGTCRGASRSAISSYTQGQARGQRAGLCR
eukprot:5619653-Prymnesium_polylepis.1